jgi:hypothetical protein
MIIEDYNYCDLECNFLKRSVIFKNGDYCRKYNRPLNYYTINNPIKLLECDKK